MANRIPPETKKSWTYDIKWFYLLTQYYNPKVDLRYFNTFPYSLEISVLLLIVVWGMSHS